MQSRFINQLKLSRRSLYPGPSRSGGTTSSALSPEPSGALSTCTLLSTSCYPRPEVEPVRKVTAQSAIKFCRSIVCRFGIPNRIITDNGTQFTSHAFMQYTQNLGTKVCFASVAHPQSNGQAERANAEVLRGLKTRSF